MTEKTSKDLIKILRLEPKYDDVIAKTVFMFYLTNIKNERYDIGTLNDHG